MDGEELAFSFPRPADGRRLAGGLPVDEIRYGPIAGDRASQYGHRTNEASGTISWPQHRLWDWLRWAIAFKMIAESLDTVFLSLERFKFLSRPAFITSAIATAFGAVGALIYGYRLLAMRRKMKQEFVEEKVREPVDARHVYGRFLYFNPSDSALFVNRYLFNFGNKWAWIFIACIIAYPLLAFWPV